MSRTQFNSAKRQTGSATLVISLMLLFAITVVTLYTTRSSIMEQNISANQVRSDQSLAAAEAGLNSLISWYNSSHWVGTTKPTSGSRWTAANFPYANAIGYDFEVFFCRDAALDDNLTVMLSCTTASDPKKVGMVAIGYSDDRSARRIIAQKVGALGVVKEGGAGATISTRASSAMTGNVTAINRYFDTTVWTGANATAMGSVQTYILDPSYDRSHLTHTELTEEKGNGTAPPPHSIEATNKAQGSGTGVKADVVTGDPNLARLTGDAFFETFFNADKATMKAKAQSEGQYFTSVPGNLASLSGLVWIENATVDPGNAGALDKPVFLVVEGDCRTNGSDMLYGLMYVTGEWKGSGRYIVKGAVGVEGAINTSGNPQVIYDPEALNPPIPPGSGGGVAGSWRDFGGN